jgi:hypothetical protein
MLETLIIVLQIRVADEHADPRVVGGGGEIYRCAIEAVLLWDLIMRARAEVEKPIPNSSCPL